MKKIAVIGSVGHFGYAVEGVRLLKETEIAGVARGCAGESMDPVTEAIHEASLSTTEYEDYRAMLDEVEPDIAVINTHFHLQAEVTAEVLRRDINAFVEKPVATSLDDLDALEAAYEASGAELIAMLGLRYDPAFFTAWQRVTGGEIGEVRLLHAQKSYRLGSRSELYKKRSTYGGTIPWVGIHAIDWIQWFGGADFISVTAGQSSKGNRDHGDLESSAACMFSLSDGVIATVNIDYFRPESAPSHGDDRIRVAGTDGVIEVRGGGVYLINGDGEGERILELADPGNIFESFASSLEGKTECLLTAADSFRATRLGLLARKSADENRQVAIS